MRRHHAVVAVAALSALLPAEPAAAFDFRALAAIYGMASWSPSQGQATDGEVGWRLRADLLRAGTRFDFKLDLWGRYGITGNPTVQELRELSMKVRDLGGRVDLTVGRFPTPGGFWLIADGARLDVHYASWVTQSVYGGLRAFATDRRNADLDFDHPVALPLAGTSLAFHHRVFDLGVTFTWAQEALSLQSAFNAQTGSLELDRHVENEYFLDAQAVIVPADTVFLSGGVSFGTRYDVEFNSLDPGAAATIGIATLGALSAWGVVDWRPVKRLRLAYSVNYERVRLIESRLLLLKADGTPLEGANGDFLDNAVRASWLLWRALRADAQYRLRYRENTDLEHHAVIGLRGDDLWRGLGAFASVGVDVYQPGVTSATRLLYSGGLSYARPWLDARAGILFTDGSGSGLPFSQATKPASGAAPVPLFPYVLESNRIVFLRLFGVWREWFAGLDVEENLDSVQLRALAQIGIAH